MKISFVYLLLSVLTILAACKDKTQESAIPPKTATLSKLLGKWQVQTVTINDGNTAVQDCEKDDVIEFKDNGKAAFQFNKGCAGLGDGNTGSYDYVISEDGRFVTISYYLQEEYNVPRQILELTQTQFKYEYTEELAQVKKYVVTFQKIN